MSEALARALLTGTGLDHTCEDPRLVETHISWLVLVGAYAYKIKKPLDLGFLDFSTLTRRKHYCEEEVRLNRRTAPDIYLGVVAISGSESAPRVGVPSKPFEYAVKMRRFDDTAMLNRLAERGALDEAIIVSLADAIAGFHESIRQPVADRRFGTPARVRQPVVDNFDLLDNVAESQDDRRMLSEVADWSEARHRSCTPWFQLRHDEGFIRECHGDLHLANIFYSNGRCTLFDCIDFSDRLRWIDVASDIAFTIMDLESYDCASLAHLLLNEYLQRTGDYGSLRVLDYYIVYRALVRAKVCGIRANQDTDHANQLRHDCSHYLELASRFTQPRRPVLILMSGLSGTGKTFVARSLAARIFAIHIRSDVERKRLFGLGMHESSHRRHLDIYSETASQRTFDELLRLARNVIEAGYPVVVDATFIERELRGRFESLADGLGIPWSIVECTASEQTVRRRLAARSGDASEAGYAQYLDQSKRVDAFDADEQARVLTVDTELPQAVASLPVEVVDGLGGRTRSTV